MEFYMSEKILSIGIDDGHSETKIILPNGRKFRIPSQATSGKVNVISINDSKEIDVIGYKTPEGSYIAGNIQHPDPTNFNDYPISVLNRVIVTHALCQAGLQNSGNLKVCTGLPLKRFYINGKPNKRLILNKMENLMLGDITPEIDFDFKIVDHRVFSEGVSAWVDYIVKKDEKGTLIIDSDMLKKRIAIVDIGGRTLDVAVVSDWKLDADRSNTFSVGMLAIRNKIADEIYNDHEVELTEEQMKSLLTTKRFKLYGREMDATVYIQEAEKQIVNTVKTQVLRLLGKASDIDEVLFVGGTSCYLEPYIAGWFPHQKIVKDAAFANARGFQKYMELMG
jgi:plasmid segregation protein ParM